MGKLEEIVRIAKKMDKMVSKKNTNGAIDLLKELKSIPMTLDLLQSTRVGMSVNAVRKQSTDEEVTTLAKSLIKSWKKLLDGPAGDKDAEDKKKECSTSSKSSSDSTEQSSSKRQEPRTPTTPKMTTFPPIPVTSDTVRNKCRELLSAALQTDIEAALQDPGRDTEKRCRILTVELAVCSWHCTGTSTEHSASDFNCISIADDYVAIGTDCDHMAAQIEEIVFQEMGNTDMKYKNRVRSRIANLKDTKNPNLRKNVLCGNISAEQIARMTAEEMASDELREIRKALTNEAIREHQMAKTGGTETALFTCGKCKKKNCTYTQVQTRSADEPMTTFVFCNECGNRWKFC
ncbi:transcription elongation factor A protein 2 isoform X1 [Carcharodon carcharias]|uniref:transcription elongation factor A protein 2 isoform X1 n=1 Tax=Carcharodon carcharias TaxID=13397 RepID=UPI001B7F015C|nr:transcription elongation factor A protein 2 isoform X1 [Carcharodon carcharias]